MGRRENRKEDPARALFLVVLSSTRTAPTDPHSPAQPSTPQLNSSRPAVEEVAVEEKAVEVVVVVVEEGLCT